VAIPGTDGFEQSAILALRDRQSPSVIILPGTFDSCDALYVRDTALFCLRHGYNVLVLESRNHGSSLDAWTTLGWKESTDILAAARWLKQSNDPGSSVAVIGFSLGAWFAIRAGYEASLNSEPELLSGGILAFSPPSDIRQAVLDWDRPEYRGNTLTLRSQVFAQFDSYLKKRIRAFGKTREFEAGGGNFNAYIDLAAKAYGLKDEDELYEKACIHAPEIAAQMRVPLVVFHAKDDPVVRVQHSLALQEALETTPSDYLKVIIKKQGGHLALHELDPQYFVRLVATVLDGLKQEGASI
jgi:predicted alpha/beta-fold hydrolase